MKLKDIKVGEEYAVAAPTAKQSRWSREPRRNWFSRVRVTKVGVHGSVTYDSTWGGRTLSQKAIYVEFEPVADESYRGGEGYEDQWVKGTEQIPARHGREERPTDRRRRCPASHILYTWADFAEEEERFVKQHEENEAESDKKLREAKAIRSALANLGVTVSIDGDDFKICKGHAEGLIVRLS